MKLCNCCGLPTTETLSVATAKSERVEIRMTGFESRLDAVNEALSALRDDKRRLTSTLPATTT